MRGRALLGAVLMVFAVVAVQHPRPASATTGIFTIDMYPPVGSDTGAAYVNCGWHSGCYSPWSDGTGVDWDDEDGSGGTCCTTGLKTVWRSWTWITNTTFLSYVADVRIHNITSSSCYRTELYIRKGGVEANRAGTIFQDHAKYGSDGYFWLHASSNGFYTGVLAGVMAADDQDKPGCNTSGAHVHEGHISVQNTWTKHVGAPPGMIRGADDCTPYPCGKFLYEDPALEPTVHSRHIAYNVTF